MRSHWCVSEVCVLHLAREVSGHPTNSTIRIQWEIRERSVISLGLESLALSFPAKLFSLCKRVSPRTSSRWRSFRIGAASSIVPCEWLEQCKQCFIHFFCEAQSFHFRESVRLDLNRRVELLIALSPPHKERSSRCGVQ